MTGMAENIEEIDFTNPQLSEMIQEQKERASLNSEKNRWPDQQGKRGPARKVGWQTILEVVDEAIKSIYFGNKMDPFPLQKFDTYNGANRLKYRLMKDYAHGLPAGVWKFDVESDEKKETFTVTAVYTPEKFSDIANIRKVSDEVKAQWIDYLNQYAERVRRQREAQE